MNQLSRFVSFHPYFKVPPDKMPYLKAILPEFAAKTRNETDNLFYEFTINGDEVFCREGYVNAEAAAGALGKRGCDASAGAGDGRPDSHRSPRTSRRARETKRAAGPSETRLVRIAQLIAIGGANYSKASIWCASWRLCAGSASTHAKVPALTAIINSKPNLNPPMVAARTNALTPSAAPICRINCWLVVALPMRSTGTLFCTTTVSAGESSPIPASAISAAAMTETSPCSNATMKKRSPKIWTTIPITLGSRSPIRWTNRPAPASCRSTIDEAGSPRNAGREFHRRDRRDHRAFLDLHLRVL